MTAATVNDASTTLTVRVPMQIRRRGGRKVVEVPQGSDQETRGSEADITLIKAIARAYRWQRMLEEGAYATMRELAAAEKISPSYISRLLHLTLIAPCVVEQMLTNGRTDGLDGSPETSCYWCEQILEYGGNPVREMGGA
jgi:hypothetical protein